MKRNFVLSVFGSFIGFGMLLILLSAAGTVGARGAEVRSDVSHGNAVAAATLTSTFRYQGQLISSGSPVSNTCDFQFSLYDALGAGNRIGITQTVSSVSVSRGLFTALLNVGNEFGDTAFNGDARWLSIAVRCPTSGAYTALSPRQPLTSLPFALPGLSTFPNAFSPNIIGGYSGNFISSTVFGSVIGGGGSLSLVNRIQANHATVSGGYSNTASGLGDTISGGGFNTTKQLFTTVSGGFSNTASSYAATVGGGTFNTASGRSSFIGGGGYDGSSVSGNQASGDAATIGGGFGNTISTNGSYAFIGGGRSNTASGANATVGGGYYNTASGTNATVGGGNSNTASGGYAGTVSGGYNNHANGDYATVGGGRFNTADGLDSMILGGANNTVTGTNSMAGGYSALANGDGCFAWGDNSTSSPISCQGDNLWSIRATGGFYFRPSINIFCSLTDVSGWQCINTSDRNAKQDFVAVNPRQVLNQVAALPIEKWAYQDDATHLQHIGPMAQDFYAAFNVGADDKHINPVDSIGVALAAIQGLYQQNQELKAQIEAVQNQTTPPASFNWFNLIGLIALAISGLTFFKMQQQLKQGGRS